MSFERWWSVSGALMVVASCSTNNDATGQAEHSPPGVGECEMEDAAVNSARSKGGVDREAGGTESGGEDSGRDGGSSQPVREGGGSQAISDDAGREGGRPKPVSDDAGRDGGALPQSWDSEVSIPADAGQCLTESAVAALSEDEQEYVADGDLACAGNEGCTYLPELWMRVECGDGDQYHCVTCRDEVCVELEFVVECSTADNWQQDGGE